MGASSKPSLAQLRELIRTTEYQEKERSSFSLFPQGFPLGSLTVVSGPGKTEFVVTFIGEYLKLHSDSHSKMKIAWIEEKMSINPFAIQQKEIDLENIVFVEARTELSWCLGQVLQTGCFPVTVVDGGNFAEKDMRRFQLLAEKIRGHVFWLSSRACKSWAPHLQLEISKGMEVVNGSSQLDIRVLRKRGFG